MPSYIYKIVSPHTRRVYIGSTIQNPKYRFRCHKSYFKSGCHACSSYEIFQEGDASYQILETIADDKNKNEIEKKYIDQYRDRVVNYHYADRKTRKGKKQYKKREGHVSRNPYYIKTGKIRVQCLCGINIAVHNRRNHYKSKKHNKMLSKLFFGVND